MILALGYTGIAVLMALESIILPLPSEAILPFAGFLAATGELNLWLITIAATIGSLIGSTVSYAVGRYGGRPFLARYGKYFLLHENSLAKADMWFTRYGDRTVFIGRLLPVVRHFISIPAGIARMRLTHFYAYTAAGAFLWNLLLTYTGFVLGENWTAISRFTAPFEAGLVVLVLIAILWYVYEAIRKRSETLQRLHDRGKRIIRR